MNCFVNKVINFTLLNKNYNFLNIICYFYLIVHTKSFYQTVIIQILHDTMYQNKINYKINYNKNRNAQNFDECFVKIVQCVQAVYR